MNEHPMLQLDSPSPWSVSHQHWIRQEPHWHAATGDDGSGGFGTLAERKNGQGCVRLAVGVEYDGRLGSGGGLGGNGSGVGADAGVGFFFDADQTLIGNFPAEVAMFAALLEILLEEDGTAGIGDENAGSGQKNIASAVLHFHTTPEEG